MTRGSQIRLQIPTRCRGSGLGQLFLFFAWGFSLAAQPATNQVPPLAPALTNEVQAFAVAERAFKDKVFDTAEREFGAFVEAFPQSTRRAEALLYQARAAIEQQQLQVALDRLTAHGTNAGAFADRYRYWQGTIHRLRADHATAAATFAQLARDFPDSVLLLEAGYYEAEARFKLGEWPQVVALLQRPDGTFQKAAKVRANDELAARGQMLLAEALLRLNEFKAAEQGVSGLAEGTLIPEFKWRRQYLLCRIALADKRIEAALAATTNLLALATAAGQAELLAESVALQADLLQRLNQLAAAVDVYEKNLLAGVPAAYRRKALVHVIELTLAQGNIGEAAQRLQEFLANHPEDAAADLALLTLGEVHLKLAAGSAATNVTLVPTNPPAAATNAPLAGTNHVQAALARFDQLITTHTNSPFLGKAHLQRGWSLWLEGKRAESLPAFARATELLALSEDLAVARFKLADGQFQLHDFTNALRNYQTVVKDFEAFPRVRNTLFDQALYQILRVSLQLGDLAGAGEAMQSILEWFPDSHYGDRGMLLVGQGLTEAQRPAEARRLFADAARRLPQSPLVPEIELAVARTYVQERQWDAAVAQYAGWVERFPDSPLRPRAEFNRAWANYQAGQLTNALRGFTNFVAQYPQHELAPRAQFWIATYCYDQKDFVNAEKHFQHALLLHNTNFAYQARMMAGRAAFARQSWDQAIKYYFAPLINDNQCPPEVMAEAFFALGDTLVQQDPDPAKPIQKFVVARDAFSKIPQLFPTNRLVPRAWGRIGDCYLQMGAVDAKQYENATNAYHKILGEPEADVATRSQAEVGLGLALERMAALKKDPEAAALRKAAFDHCYAIVSEKNLRPGETPDPFWFKEAALQAARLAEQTGRWEAAIRIYQRLAAALPYLRSSLENKIENIRKRSGAEKS